MKAFIATMVAALLSFPAIAQEGHTKSEACEELGSVAHAAALTAYEARAGRLGYGDIHDALADAQALAADEMDILYDSPDNPMFYEVVSDMVDAIVIEIYRMPHSAFTGESIEVFTAGFRIAERARTIARAQCMRGILDVGF